MKDIPQDPFDLVLSLLPEDPERALKELLPDIGFAEVVKVANPTVAQIKAIREIEPYTEEGLTQIKCRLIEGSVRIGPQHQAILKSLFIPKLESVGLQARILSASHEELKRAKLIDDEVPRYFRNPPS